MPICSVQAINKTVIVAKPSCFNKLSAKTFIEAVSASIAGKWIDEDSRHTRVGKTSSFGKLHHSCAVAFAQICFFPRANASK
jgi:hypothetical protein